MTYLFNGAYKVLGRSYNMVKITYTLTEGENSQVKLERQVEDVSASDNEKIASVKIINLFTDCLEASINGETIKKEKNTKKKGK